MIRGVAQLASALAWGARGRKFESSHPDIEKKKARFLSCFFLLLRNRLAKFLRKLPMSIEHQPVWSIIGKLSVMTYQSTLISYTLRNNDAIYHIRMSIIANGQNRNFI